MVGRNLPYFFEVPNAQFQYISQKTDIKNRENEPCPLVEWKVLLLTGGTSKVLLPSRWNHPMLSMINL